MASKKVSFGTKPQKQPEVDAWVESREAPKDETTQRKQPGEQVTAKTRTKSPEKEVERNATKRLTLDIPESLHRRIKGKAVMEGVTMVNMLRELLEEIYG